MIARWEGICDKCETSWARGDNIKPRYKRAGYADGKPIWVRVPKAYVHAPRCPPVPKKRSPQVDPQTGEILLPQSAAPSPQGSLFTQ
jgi:hypothetical protein